MADRRANDEAAALLETLADYLEAQEDDYRPQAYRRAAEGVREYPTSIEALAAEGTEALEEVPGVGESIAEKLAEFVETGEIAELERQRERLPVEMEALDAVEGVGPKTVGKLYRALGIATLDDLERNAREGKIRAVEGFGETSERNLLEAVAFARESQRRTPLGEARPLATSVCDHLLDAAAVEACEPAGSMRRWRETVGDVDVLAASDDPAGVVDRFVAWPDTEEVIEAGTNKAAVRASDLRVDLRVVVPEEWGSALQHFTGSKAHNVHLRNHAISRGQKVNEYGVFDVSAVPADEDGQRAGERLAGETEESVYEALEMAWIPPEVREDDGEIEAALADDLPDLLDASAIRGDLHVHTEWSDGHASIEAMVEGAAAAGYDYVAISDHASGPGVVASTGLSDEELRDQLAAVREVGDDADIAVLAGVEANVDAEGNVSVADDVLADLDVVVASPHSGLSADREAATDRLCVAMEHPSVDVIGHPSGRLLGRRAGMELDLERLAATAAREGVALEVNSNPARLDLWGAAVRVAVEAGAALAIDTDAHSPREYGLVEYGVHTARRGWATAADVLNARDETGLRAFLH